MKHKPVYAYKTGVTNFRGVTGLARLRGGGGRNGMPTASTSGNRENMANMGLSAYELGSAFREPSVKVGLKLKLLPLRSIIVVLAQPAQQTATRKQIAA
jgi:hypothetical protein